MTTPTVAERQAAEPSTRRKGRFGGGNALVYAVALAVIGVTLGPVLYAAMSGFRTTGQLTANPVSLPNPWVLDNYINVLTSGNFWRYALNSVVIAVITTAVVVVLGVMAAYPLARYEFRGRELLYSVFTLGLMFPIAVAIVPLFLMVRDLQLVNSFWGVALPQAAFALPVTIVILRPFLMAFPKELEEAALIDGTSRLGFFWRILLPLSGPGLVTVGVLAFVGSWNAYLLPLLVLNQPSAKTLPLGVADFSTEHAVDTAGVLAFTTVAMIPALVFFLAMQKHIVSGLQGAVKG